MNKNDKLAEIATVLIDHGKVTEATRFLEASLASSTKKEASGPDFFDYLNSAEEKFLKAAARGIKQVARSHAESITVERSRKSVAWLSYIGQDRSDTDLKVMMSINWTVYKGPKASVFMTIDHAYRGSTTEHFDVTFAQLTPESLVDKFSQIFG